MQAKFSTDKPLGSSSRPGKTSRAFNPKSQQTGLSDGLFLKRTRSARTGAMAKVNPEIKVRTKFEPSSLSSGKFDRSKRAKGKHPSTLPSTALPPPSLLWSKRGAQ